MLHFTHRVNCGTQRCRPELITPFSTNDFFFTLCHDCRVDSQLQINIVLTPSDSPAQKQISRMTLRLRHALVLLLLLLFLEGGEGWWNRSRLRLVRQRPSPTNTNKCQVLRDLLKKTRLSQRDISMILNVDEDPIMTKYKQNSVDQRDSMAASETLHGTVKR